MGETFVDWVPNDVVSGPDPTFVVDVADVRAFRLRCACGFTVLGERPDWSRINDHLERAHPASRNPTITCHARPPWDHERWCTRRLLHDDDHWTPTMGGGLRWPNR